MSEKGFKGTEHDSIMRKRRVVEIKVKPGVFWPDNGEAINPAFWWMAYEWLNGRSKRYEIAMYGNSSVFVSRGGIKDVREAEL